MYIPSPARHLQRLACTILLLAALVVGEAAGQSSAPLAVADENAAARAKRLDALFAGLKSIKVEEEADTMVTEIWRLWLQSGNAEVDAQMQHAILLIGSVPAMAMPILDDIVARLPDWAEGWNKAPPCSISSANTTARSPTATGCWPWSPGTSVRSLAPREALAAFRKALAVNPFLKERLDPRAGAPRLPPRVQPLLIASCRRPVLATFP